MLHFSGGGVTTQICVLMCSISKKQQSKKVKNKTWESEWVEKKVSGVSFVVWVSDSVMWAPRENWRIFWCFKLGHSPNLLQKMYLIFWEKNGTTRSKRCLYIFGFLYFFELPRSLFRRKYNLEWKMWGTTKLLSRVLCLLIFFFD